MINVTKSFLPSLEEYESKLEQIWKSGWLTNEGQYETELTIKLSEWLSIPHIELVANGTLALQLAIKALNLTGEIITTPFSYVATPNAIVWEGCTPVFADIDEKTLCINPDLIEDAITEKTSAILATHVYGYPCAVDRIAQIAIRHNLKVIYDAAHCFGVKLNGESILKYGDISTLSFHATKLFHTAEGGALVCHDKALSDHVYLLKKFGHIGEDEYVEVGINAKMSELNAAMGLCVLPMVDEIIATRRQLSAWYDEIIADSQVSRPTMPQGLDYNYNYYPVLFSSNEQMMQTRQKLVEQDIMPRRYFYPPLNTLPYLQQAGYKPCPVSESVAMRVLCLPLYFELQKEEILRIANIVTGRSS
ncbi:MAG: DegT/DnrJ/EryC1/StrS family aminotransferase [Candidatus Cloacimonetes bacterium]|nr:DegT/DnrJ/EryC1/StrS family aminotransferase [Candidatus Cloacimonadota bacterium]